MSTKGTLRSHGEPCRAKPTSSTETSVSGLREVDRARGKERKAKIVDWLQRGGGGEYTLQRSFDAWIMGHLPTAATFGRYKILKIKLVFSRCAIDLVCSDGPVGLQA